MNQASQPKTRKDSRIKRLLVLLAILSGGFMALMTLFAGLMIGREYLKEIPRPTYEYSAGGILRPALAAAEETTGTASVTKRTANPGPAREIARVGLKFEPMIPDTPDIPEALKARAGEMNRRFDAIFQRIEELDKNREKLSSADTAKTVAGIDMDYRNLFAELLKPLNYKLTSGGGQGRIMERNREYQRWYYPAAIQTRERAGNWLAAAGISRQYWDFQRGEWELAHYDDDLGGPVFLSDYDRESQHRDYQRILYYYRKTGGMNGVVHVGELFLKQKKREWMDALGRFRSGS